MANKTQPKHLDKRELISPGVLLKYHHARPPGDATKRSLRKAASIARSCMRSTVWAIDKCVLFHTDEPDVFTAIVDKHFGLNRSADLASTKDAKKKLVHAKARRAYLAKVRKVMLSTSFHLNTGVYLLDIDAKHRTTVGDYHIDNMDAGWQEAGPAGGPANVVGSNIEGYVQQRYKQDKAGAWQHDGAGPVHVAYSLTTSYSPEMIARVIIHEATHSFCKTTDVKYCWDPDYDIQDPYGMLTNADSYAFAAMSFGAKRCLDSDTLKNYAHS